MPHELLREDILLAVFELAEFAMSAEELAKTFNLEAEHLRPIFEDLEEEGYLEYFGNGYYKSTTLASDRVETQLRATS